MSACHGGKSPVAPTPPAAQPPVSVTGQVTDRITNVSLPNGSSIEWVGPESRLSPVANGTYEVRDLPAGDYRVTIRGNNHVTHTTERVSIAVGHEVQPFSVLVWGRPGFGATYDDMFHKFFHQIARVGTSQEAVRKWILQPTELYVVSGTVPAEQFELVWKMLDEVNDESVPAMWGGTIAPIKMVRGAPCLPDCQAYGRIVVEPNWADGASGTLLPQKITFGKVTINVFRPISGRLLTAQEIKAGLAHELFHVAFAFHVCGGDLGTNPWGWAWTNCPYPNSLMANLATGVTTLSPEDQLAAYLVYHRDTYVGNAFPDNNPGYW
jgi:hypothetical protein